MDNGCINLQCSPYASCRMDESVNSMRCVCNDGYMGDGISCSLSSATESCSISENCSPYGSCQPDQYGNFGCICLPGFHGDGYTCFLDPSFDDSLGLVPVSIDKIPEYVLGSSNYSDIPVEFDSNPYGVNLVGNEGGNYPDVPYIGIGNTDDNKSPSYSVHSQDNHLGYRFDDGSIRPAVPIDPHNIHSPYVPPQLPDEPLQPYQPPYPSDPHYPQPYPPHQQPSQTHPEVST